jgi:transcriptional regulator with XRE-family HTH domain
MSSVFGQSIRDERELRGQSLAEFSAMLDISKAALKRWERGLSTPTQAKIDQIHAKLHQSSRPVSEPWMCHPGWWLRIGRARHRRSIRKAAEVAGISASTWMRYEDGSTPVSRSQAVQLVDVLGPQIPGFTLSDEDPSEVLKRAMNLMMTRPDLGAALSTSACLGDLDPSRLKLAHAVLGRSLIVMNEHDLAGRASMAAKRLPGKFDEGEYDEAHVEAVALWSGFRVQEPGQDAEARLRILDRRARTWSTDMQQMSELIRSMLNHWSNPQADVQTDLRSYVRRHPGCHYTPIAELMAAWADAVQDRPMAAGKAATQHTGSETTYVKFLAHKVLFECAIRSGDRDWAREALVPLEAHRDDDGLWAPDLTEKMRRVNAAFLH